MTGCRDCDGLTSGRCPAHAQTITIGVVVPASGPVLTPLLPVPECDRLHPGVPQDACTGGLLLVCREREHLRAEVERLTRELADARARLDCGLTDAEREASPNRNLCRMGAAEAAASPLGDGRDCAACDEWDAGLEIEHLLQTWTRVEKERDEARALIAEIHGACGRGDHGSAKANAACILDRIVSASMDAGDERQEHERELAEARAQAAAEGARAERLLVALRSAHDLLTALTVHVSGLGPIEDRVGEEQARTATAIAESRSTYAAGEKGR